MGFKKHAKNRQLVLNVDASTPLTMHYQEWGEKDNPEVLICVHGLTRNSHDFDFLAKQLCKDYRVICPDIWGRGESAWLPSPLEYDYPIYLQQMQAFMDHLRLRKVHWLGTSMGGILGMMIAATNPDSIKRLILNDVGAKVSAAGLQEIAAYIGQEMEFEDNQQVEAFMRATYSGFGELNDKHWQHLATYACFTNSDNKRQLAYDPRIAQSFKSAVTDLDSDIKSGLKSDIDLSAIWQQITSPTLIIRGQHSNLLTASCANNMAQATHAHVVEVEGCGHAPALMKKKQVAQVRDFLFSRL